MALNFVNCRLPLGEGTSFCVEGGRFVPPRQGGERRDLGGALVVPAPIDAHSHLLACALTALQTDGSACRNEEEVLALARRARPTGPVLTVANVPFLPSAARLDAFPAPLHVAHRSGHGGAFNAAARRLLGIEEEGTMTEAAYFSATSRIPMPAIGEVERALDMVGSEYLAGGFCLAQEGLLTRPMFPLYQSLCRRLPLDVVAFPAPADYDDARRLFAGTPLRIGGIKLLLDGSPQQRTACLRAPYTDGSNAPPAMTAEEVADACRFALDRGAQLLAHCNGDGAIDLLLRALAPFTPEERRRLHPVAIHAQLAGDDQLDMMKELGVTPSFFPAHVRDWAREHLCNLGRERAQRISPARSALVRGLPFTLHQDSPVAPPDALALIRHAVLRESPVGDFTAQAIGPLDALRAVTKNAATQYLFCDRGAIAPGFRADFLVLDGTLSDVASLRIRETWVAGVCRFSTQKGAP